MWVPVGIPVYLQLDSHEAYGELRMENDGYGVYVYDRVNEKRFDANLELHFEQVGYEQYCLRYHERRDGYVKILHESQYLWIHEGDLEEFGYFAGDYIDLMDKIGKDVLGHFAKDPGLNLREGTAVNYAKIVTMKGETMQIRYLGERKGAWGRVEVRIHDDMPCDEGYSLLKTYKGWAKLLDDSGVPNVYFYPRGC